LAASAGPVVDDDGLAPGVTQRGSGDARDDVAAAARRQGDDHADGTGRKGGGRCNAARRGCERDRDNQVLPAHCLSPASALQPDGAGE
jgi:hypothetical protein